jgi:hypothetical protein
MASHCLDSFPDTAPFFVMMYADMPFSFCKQYLDRESLGALAGAIREFDGGVVMITHNNEFCSALCPETWLVENNTVNLKGDPEWMKQVANEKVWTRKTSLSVFHHVVMISSVFGRLQDSCLICP